MKSTRPSIHLLKISLILLLCGCEKSNDSLLAENFPADLSNAPWQNFEVGDTEEKHEVSGVPFREKNSAQVYFDFIHASGTGSIEQVEKYLLAWESRSRTFKGATESVHSPLSYACLVGRPDVVNLLISSGADVNQFEMGADGAPLYCAAKEGNLDCLSLLIKNGAKLNKYVTLNDIRNHLVEKALLPPDFDGTLDQCLLKGLAQRSAADPASQMRMSTEISTMQTIKAVSDRNQQLKKFLLWLESENAPEEVSSSELPELLWRLKHAVAHGQYQDAVAFGAATKCETSRDCLLLLAFSNLHLSPPNPHQAIEYFSKAEDIGPLDNSWSLELSKAYAIAGKFDTAEQVLHSCKQDGHRLLVQAEILEMHNDFKHRFVGFDEIDFDGDFANVLRLYRQAFQTGQLKDQELISYARAEIKGMKDYSGEFLDITGIKREISPILDKVLLANPLSSDAYLLRAEIAKRRDVLDNHSFGREDLYLALLCANGGQATAKVQLTLSHDILMTANGPLSIGAGLKNFQEACQQETLDPRIESIGTKVYMCFGNAVKPFDYVAGEDLHRSQIYGSVGNMLERWSAPSLDTQLPHSQEEFPFSPEQLATGIPIGDALLLEASLEHRWKHLEFLVSRGYNVNIQDEYGKTALFNAVNGQGLICTPQWLLTIYTLANAGADASIATSDGKMLGTRLAELQDQLVIARVRQKAEYRRRFPNAPRLEGEQTTKSYFSSKQIAAIKDVKEKGRSDSLIAILREVMRERIDAEIELGRAARKASDDFSRRLESQRKFIEFANAAIGSQIMSQNSSRRQSIIDANRSQNSVNDLRVALDRGDRPGASSFANALTYAAYLFGTESDEYRETVRKIRLVGATVGK